MYATNTVVLYSAINEYFMISSMEQSMTINKCMTVYPKSSKVDENEELAT